MEQGILVPWDWGEHGAIKNVILLMSVRQTKGENHKVCLVWPGGMPTCDERICEWRMMGQDCVILDLKKAYLQVFVEKDLWVHQAVRWEGKVFLLTHLAFGMNMAPKIMTAIVQSVLRCNEAIIDDIDDIIVAGGNMNVAKVKAHLKSCGLQAKEPEGLGEQWWSMCVGFEG